MISLMVAALVQAGPASAPPAPDLPVGAVVNPVWINRPTARELAAAYPIKAAADETTGNVTMECVVDAGGRLTDCRVAFETPTGVGFGEAVLKISRHFRMRSTDADGAPTVGRTVRIPLRLIMPAEIQTSLIKLPSARWAGRTADVDCRVRGSSIDNCQTSRVDPYDPDLWKAVGDLPPKLNRWVAGDIQGRVKFRFQFVAPPKP